MKSPEIDNIIAAAETLREGARYQQSIKLFKEALQVSRKIRDKEGTYHCIRALGDVYRMTGRFERAAKMYTEAVRLARGIHSLDKAADALIQGVAF